MYNNESQLNEKKKKEKHVNSKENKRPFESWINDWFMMSQSLVGQWLVHNEPIISGLKGGKKYSAEYVNGIIMRKFQNISYYIMVQVLIYL